MEILKIVALSIGSMFILFVLTKIMGQREMSQLSIFDYIITITIRIYCSWNVNFIRK